MSGKVAPHINNEVRLVLAGYKPLATTENGKDPYGYSLAISMACTEALKAQARPTRDDSTGEVIIVLPHNKALIQEYIELQASGVSRVGIKQYHREMGRLFGYTAEDIETFINSEVDCNCAKCRGGV